MSAITTATVVGITAAAGSAGASIYAAKKGSDAAKNAAATQSAAAQKALDFQKQQYAQVQQNFDPYRQAGASALGRLGTQATTPAPVFQPGQPQPSFASLGNPMGGQMPQQGMGQAIPNPQVGQSPAMMQGGQQGQQGGQGMVLMLGPDGSRRPVPAQVAQQLTQRGFKVISNA